MQVMSRNIASREWQRQGKGRAKAGKRLNLDPALLRLRQRQ